MVCVLRKNYYGIGKHQILDESDRFVPLEDCAKPRLFDNGAAASRYLECNLGLNYRFYEFPDWPLPKKSDLKEWMDGIAEHGRQEREKKKRQEDQFNAVARQPDASFTREGVLVGVWRVPGGAILIEKREDRWRLHTRREIYEDELIAFIELAGKEPTPIAELELADEE